jgi:hypothetical protein
MSAALSSFASERFAFSENFALTRFAWLRYAPLRSAELRFAP